MVIVVERTGKCYCCVKDIDGKYKGNSLSVYRQYESIGLILHIACKINVQEGLLR